MGVETALRGLLAQQRALDTSGHNIANANTAGYTRQTVNMTASMPQIDTGHGLIGTGVDVTSYSRARDQFMDIQVRAQSMQLGQADARQQGLQQIEANLNEPSDNGISSLLQKYWASWQDVANNPESKPAREALVENGATLASSIQDLGSQLTTISGQNDTNITLTIDQANSDAQKIADLNKAIASLGPQAGSANDLLDQRDQLLDDLSTLGNVSWQANAANDGSIDVTIGGTAVVSGQTATALNDTAGSLGTTFASLSSGKLKALSDLKSTTIPTYQTQLNNFASLLASSTNSQHALGFDAYGNAGGNFFDVTAGDEAATIQVNAALTADPMKVAASSTAPAAGDSSIGDGGNALAIGNLAGGAADSAYESLVRNIGADSQTAQRTYANQKVLSDSLQNQRESVSGVSLDEEMSNLLRFQRGYQASSRALNVMSDALDLLINRTGRVGL